MQGYQTIYSNIYFTDSSTSETYFLLEGENAQKIEEGQRLIVKRDSNGYTQSCRYTTVLEKESKTEGFITPIVPTTPPAGVYMKMIANVFSS